VSCRRITYTPCVATGNKLTETFGEVLKRNNACSGIKPLVSRCGSHKTKHTQWPKQLPKTGNNICVHIYILGLKIADGECWHGISQDIVCTQRQMNCHEVRTAKKKKGKQPKESCGKFLGSGDARKKEIPDQLKLNQFLSGLRFCISKSSNIYYKMSACCSPDTCHSHRCLRLMLLLMLMPLSPSLYPSLYPSLSPISIPISIHSLHFPWHKYL